MIRRSVITAVAVVVFVPLFVPSLPAGRAAEPAAAVGQPVPMPLSSHRALYRMVLGRSQPASGIADARGAMFVKFEEACDGWKSEISTRMLFDYGEEGEILSEWEFSSWEARDGLRFLFRSEEREGPDVISHVEGSATLSAPGLEGWAEYVKPVETAFELPAGTRFPTHHLLELIDAGRQGRNLYAGPLFDGAGLNNPFFVSAVIRRLRPAELAAMAKSLGGPDGDAWQMHLAFYPIDSVEQLPNFQITMRYREDGIADRMHQDYGDFTVGVFLDNLDFLPAPTC